MGRNKLQDFKLLLQKARQEAAHKEAMADALRKNPNLLAQRAAKEAIQRAAAKEQGIEFIGTAARVAEAKRKNDEAIRIQEAKRKNDEAIRIEEAKRVAEAKRKNDEALRQKAISVVEAKRKNDDAIRQEAKRKNDEAIRIQEAARVAEAKRKNDEAIQREAAEKQGIEFIGTAAKVAEAKRKNDEAIRIEKARKYTAAHIKPDAKAAAQGQARVAEAKARTQAGQNPENNQEGYPRYLVNGEPTNVRPQPTETKGAPEFYELLQRFPPEVRYKIEKALYNAQERLPELNLPGDRMHSEQDEFAPIQHEAERKFAKDVIPSIAQRFAGMGSGASLSSGVLHHQLSSAHADLQSQLAAMRAEYGIGRQGRDYNERNEQAKNLNTLLSYGHTKTEDQRYNAPQDRLGTPGGNIFRGFGKPLIDTLAAATGTYFGGPGGGAAAYGASNAVTGGLATARGPVQGYSNPKYDPNVAGMHSNNAQQFYDYRKSKSSNAGPQSNNSSQNNNFGSESLYQPMNQNRESAWNPQENYWDHRRNNREQ